MDVVKITLWACGNYAGCDHEESVIVSREFYEKIHDKVSNLKVPMIDFGSNYRYGASGIDIDFCEEAEISDWYVKTINDGYILKKRLNSISKEFGLSLPVEIIAVQKYISKFDYYVEAKTYVRKSNVNKFYELTEEL